MRDDGTVQPSSNLTNTRVSHVCRTRFTRVAHISHACLCVRVHVHTCMHSDRRLIVTVYAQTSMVRTHLFRPKFTAL